MKIISTLLYQLFTSSLLVAALALIPFALFLAIMTLELAVSFIQAYVISILLCSYIKDAINLH
jgi:F-type H+-transporting ATPase subunit a